MLRVSTNADDATRVSLKAHVKSLLTPYKSPRWISFVSELPKIATGKIQRFCLRNSQGVP